MHHRKFDNLPRSSTRRQVTFSDDVICFESHESGVERLHTAKNQHGKEIDTFLVNRGSRTSNNGKSCANNPRHQRMPRNESHDLGQGNIADFRTAYEASQPRQSNTTLINGSTRSPSRRIEHLNGASGSDYMDMTGTTNSFAHNESQDSRNREQKTKVSCGSSKDALKGKSIIRLSANVHAGILTVHLIKARHLVSVHHPLCRSMAKVKLIPEISPAVTCHTDVISDTNHPTFDEKYSFELVDEDLTKRLYISLWNMEERRGTLEFLGSTSFGVRHIITKQRRVDGWYYLLHDIVGRRKHVHAVASKDARPTRDFLHSHRSPDNPSTHTSHTFISKSRHLFSPQPERLQPHQHTEKHTQLTSNHLVHGSTQNLETLRDIEQVSSKIAKELRHTSRLCYKDNFNDSLIRSAVGSPVARRKGKLNDDHSARVIDEAIRQCVSDVLRPAIFDGNGDSNDNILDTKLYSHRPNENMNGSTPNAYPCNSSIESKQMDSANKVSSSVEMHLDITNNASRWFGPAGYKYIENQENILMADKDLTRKRKYITEYHDNRDNSTSVKRRKVDERSTVPLAKFGSLKCAIHKKSKSAKKKHSHKKGSGPIKVKCSDLMSGRMDKASGLKFTVPKLKSWNDQSTS